MGVEIKFRAWDKDGKRMFSFNLPDIFNEGCEHNVINNDPKHVGIYTQFPYIDMPLMQFTGLKDKNKKDIYVGDLVRQSGTLYEIRACIGGFECQILKEYKNGGTEEGSCYMFSCLLDYACEVIGNIYENSDLL